MAVNFKGIYHTTSTLPKGTMVKLRCGHEVSWWLGDQTLPPEILWCRECRARVKRT